MNEGNDRAVLWNLIKDTKFCMLSHRHGDGSLHAHPMTTQNRELGEDGCLYFFMSRASEVGQRVRDDPNVNLAYANRDDDTWVSITGTARVIEDAQKKRELFGTMDKAWFPDGPDSPELELVEVRIDEAEYWNVKENKLLQLLKMGKAAATGSRPQQMGEHRTLHLH
jgi:general stress protein 26